MLQDTSNLQGRLEKCFFLIINISYNIFEAKRGYSFTITRTLLLFYQQFRISLRLLNRVLTTVPGKLSSFVRNSLHRNKSQATNRNDTQTTFFRRFMKCTYLFLCKDNLYHIFTNLRVILYNDKWYIFIYLIYKYAMQV